MAKSGSAPVAINDFAKSNGSDPVSHVWFPEGPSMTRQEFADECDINRIMERYDAYLSDPLRTIREPVYYDFTAQPNDLMHAMEILHQGEMAFNSLPATVRREFDNNAALFVDFAADPENLPQMRTWGLAAPEKEPERPMRVEVVNPDPPAPPPEPPAGGQGGAK